MPGRRKRETNSGCVPSLILVALPIVADPYGLAMLATGALSLVCNLSHPTCMLIYIRRLALRIPHSQHAPSATTLLIGIAMLMSLVTKNGILLVDFTNTLRQRDGMERDAAVLKAGPIRLRPILMTTFAMIFGMLPIAIYGSELRSPMAVAVIGGLTTSTLLTLVVVPVAYTLLDDLLHPSRWRVPRWLRSRRPASAAVR